MIHIKKSKDKKFYVVVTGDNNETLSTSEMLNSKQAAWKNLEAQHKIFCKIGRGEGVIQDDTKKKK